MPPLRRLPHATRHADCGTHLTLWVADALTNDWSQNAHLSARPEGPLDSSPGRQAGVGDFDCMSAEGAALNDSGWIECRAFGARFSANLIPA